MMPNRPTARFLPMLAMLAAIVASAQEISVPQPSLPQIEPPALPVTEPVPGVAIDPGEADSTGGMSTEARDIVLVLDNSSSMKTTDPQGLLGSSVIEFASGLDADSSLAILLYGQDIKLALPLVPASIENRERIAAAVAGLDYQGPYSDSPAALERAMVELNTSGRPGASKSLVFVTDGPVETTNPAADTERSLWLQQEFTVAASAAGVRIYTLGLAGAAGSELVKTLALKTGAESFEAVDATQLAAAFASLNTYLKQEAGPVQVSPEPAIEPASPPVAPVAAAPAAMNRTEIPIKPAGQEEKMRSTIIWVAAVILIITLSALIFILMRRGKLYKQAAGATISEAYLYDLNGVTPVPRYKLGQKPIMLGRVAGKDTQHLDYIVIPESTIGRRHATIEYKDYAWWIMDQGSINGTFVNDVRVNSEVRLKHGDRVRLHKIEFDFIMPDHEEAGMTRVAEPVGAVAASGAAAVGAVELDVEAVKSSLGSEGMDLDFDFSGGSEVTDAGREKDETLMPGIGPEANSQADSPDVTLMPDYDPASEKPSATSRTAGARASVPQQLVQDDETLLPVDYNGIDEDETLRPSPGSESEVFDVTGSDKDR